MILCCGEALIDMLPRETTRGEEGFAPYCGGAVFNSAVALGRLGVPVGFLSGLSIDLFGEMIRKSLAESGVTTAYARLADRPTTLAFVKLVDGQARYIFYDENSAGRMLSPADIPPIGEEVTALLLGAISLIGDPCGSAYESLMTREHAGRVTMLDPNIRPDFIRDAAAYLARLTRMAAMADIMKFSDEDLAWFGETGTMQDAAMRWLERGPKLVVVTRGGDGATAYSSAGEVTVPAQRVKVVDTVGAGDTFNAGLLAGLHDEGLLTKEAVASLTLDQVRGALELGIRAAAVTVSRAGANPPWRKEL